jgi:hypothetical protein
VSEILTGNAVGGPLPLVTTLRLLPQVRDPQRAQILLREAFADADEGEQVALLQSVNVEWLQTVVRSVLDELDEEREAAIEELRAVLAAPLEYLLLT